MRLIEIILNYDEYVQFCIDHLGAGLLMGSSDSKKYHFNCHNEDGEEVQKWFVFMMFENAAPVHNDVGK